MRSLMYVWMESISRDFNRQLRGESLCGSGYRVSSAETSVTRRKCGIPRLLKRRRCMPWISSSSCSGTLWEFEISSRPYFTSCGRWWSRRNSFLNLTVCSKRNFERRLATWLEAPWVYALLWWCTSWRVLRTTDTIFQVFFPCAAELGLALIHLYGSVDSQSVVFPTIVFLPSLVLVLVYIPLLDLLSEYILVLVTLWIAQFSFFVWVVAINVIEWDTFGLFFHFCFVVLFTFFFCSRVGGFSLLLVWGNAVFRWHGNEGAYSGYVGLSIQ